MEELILRYIDAKELGFPEGETPRLQVDRAVFEESEGRLEIGLTSNFVVPSYVLDVVKDSICQNIPGVREVRMDFRYENLVEVIRPKAVPAPRERPVVSVSRKAHLSQSAAPSRPMRRRAWGVMSHRRGSTGRV